MAIAELERTFDEMTTGMEVDAEISHSTLPVARADKPETPIDEKFGVHTHRDQAHQVARLAVFAAAQ